MFAVYFRDFWEGKGPIIVANAIDLATKHLIVPGSSAVACK